MCGGGRERRGKPLTHSFTHFLPVFFPFVFVLSLCAPLFFVPFPSLFFDLSLSFLLLLFGFFCTIISIALSLSRCFLCSCRLCLLPVLTHATASFGAYTHPCVCFPGSVCIPFPLCSAVVRSLCHLSPLRLSNRTHTAGETDRPSEDGNFIGAHRQQQQQPL